MFNVITKYSGKSHLIYQFRIVWYKTKQFKLQLFNQQFVEDVLRNFRFPVALQL